MANKADGKVGMGMVLLRGVGAKGAWGQLGLSNEGQLEPGNSVQ
jgi:hypothetical protein